MIDPIDSREILLLDIAHFYGATVHLAHLPGTQRGRYIRSRQQILLRYGMTSAQRVSALAHEVVHARRGDDGPQPPDVEDFVDEEAAGLIVTAAGYAAAEAAVGSDPRALAAELDVTPWLVMAWQRRAARMVPAVPA